MKPADSHSQHVLQCLLHMPQIDFAANTAASTAKARNSGKSWGMCSKHCNTSGWVPQPCNGPSEVQAVDGRAVAKLGEPVEVACAGEDTMPVCPSALPAHPAGHATLPAGKHSTPHQPPCPTLMLATTPTVRPVLIGPPDKKSLWLGHTSSSK